MNAHNFFPTLVVAVFCFYILRRNLKDEPGFSSTLWLPTLWMMRCASRSLDYWASGHGMELVRADSANLASTSIVDVIFLGTLTVVGLIALGRRRLDWNEVIRDNRVIMLFFVYMLLSCLWSETMFVSIKRYFRALGDLTMALLVLTEGRPLAAVYAVIRRTAIFFVPGSILMCKYYPIFGRLTSKSWSVPDMWVGLATHKNSLTAFLMLMAILFIWRMVQARNGGPPLMKLPGPRWFTMELLYLAMAAYLMFNSRSRSVTAIMALSVGCLLLFIFQRIGTQKQLLFSWFMRLAIVFVALQIICLVLAGESAADVLLEIQGKSTNLTGRTEFWPILVHFGMTHPLLGAGYGGFWTPQMLEYFLEISIYGSVPEAHNGYLEVFLNLGIVGLIFLGTIIWKAMSAAWRNLEYDFESSRIRLIILAMILVHNIAEASFQRDNNAVWFTFLMLVLTPPASTLIHTAEAMDSSIVQAEEFHTAS